MSEDANKNITKNLDNELVDQYYRKEKAADRLVGVILVISFAALVYGLVNSN